MDKGSRVTQSTHRLMRCCQNLSMGTKCSLELQDLMIWQLLRKCHTASDEAILQPFHMVPDLRNWLELTWLELDQCGSAMEL